MLKKNPNDWHNNLRNTLGVRAKATTTTGEIIGNQQPKNGCRNRHHLEEGTRPALNSASFVTV